MLGQVTKPIDQASTRERILQAALELIVDIGWANVTTRAISARAGVNNALVHYHFGTKDELLLAAAEVSFAQEMGAPLDAILATGDATEALVAAFRWMESTEPHSPMMVVFMEAAHQAVRDERVAAWIRQVLSAYFQAITAVVVAGQAKGDIDQSVDPESLAIVVAGLIDGLFLYRLIGLEYDASTVRETVEGFIQGMTKGT